jgi:SRSO17 transposase
MEMASGPALPTPPPSGQPGARALTPSEVEALAEELQAYHARFAPLFRRTEQRHWSLKYLQGQLLNLERKSVEPMALAVEGGNVQAMQQFISVGAWDDDTILQEHQRLIAETLGDPASGVLIIDGCTFPKQGSHSVGVAPQWCGALGKVANCQASVVACYASARGYALVDRRLYLPERWFTPAYRERWERCGIPDDTPFQTEPELAWALIEQLQQRGVLPFRWVVFDEQFGNNPALLDRVARAGLSYLAEVPHNTLVWRRRPQTQIPPAPARGRPPTHPRLCAGAPPPVRVDQLVTQVPRRRWQRYVIKEGAKGPLVAEFACVRAVAVREGLLGPAVWVVYRRSLGEGAELKVYLSNAPVQTPHRTLVWVSGMRWPVETAIEESKDEVGMDHYEVRGWRGWHHHLTLSLLAHGFLTRLRGQLGEKIGGVDGAPSAPVAAGRPAALPPRRPDGARPHPTPPTPELCRLLLPSPTHAAQVGHVLAK